ncbi:MAG: ABC transporter ATP-binding protein [Candidatus Binatia bacterium]
MIEVWRLAKTYPAPGGGEAVIVHDFNLRIRPGEFVCLIGHSGCGKSTVLSIVMGLVPPTSGAVIVAGKEVEGPGCDRGVVFQSAALLPWLTVRDNVLLALDQVNGGLPRAERVRLAERYLVQVGLEGAGDVWPDELSAGMRQRVGIARAFALESRVLLLDEPFSLLDAMTRLELQDQLAALWESTRKTVLMVTHDVDEAITLADRIVMMTPGPAATIGGIVDVPLARPRSRHAALESPEYFETRDRLLGFLESGVVEAG